MDSSSSSQLLRQLMSLDSPKVSLVSKCDINKSTTNNDNRSSTLATNTTPHLSFCCICTHLDKDTQALSLLSPDRHVYLKSLLRNEGHGPFHFCSVCLTTVTRLLNLKDEVEDIEVRIRAVLNLRGCPEDDKIESPIICKVEADEYEGETERSVHEDDLFNWGQMEILGSEADVFPFPMTTSSLEDPTPVQDLHLLPCYFCSKIFSSPTSLEAHMRRHTFEHIQAPTTRKKLNFNPPTTILGPRTRFGCPDCDKDYGRRDHLLRHMRVSHFLDPSQRQECTICKKFFPDEEVYKAHSHPDPQDPTKSTYTCSICEKICKTKSNFLQHNKFVHGGSSSNQCYFCDKVFSWTMILDAHMRTHTLERPQGEQNKAWGTWSKVGKCFECKKKALPPGESLEDHIRRVHAQPEVIACGGCGEVILKVQEYLDHVSKAKLEDPSSSCVTCLMPCPHPACMEQEPKVIRGSEGSLAIHLKAAHYIPEDNLKGRVYKCHLCERQFNVKEYRDRHVQIKHIQPSIQCDRPNCTTVVWGRDRMKDHLRTVHLVVEKVLSGFICPECGKQFKSACNLTRHRKLHSTETPFLCQECGKGYKVLDQFKTHMWTHDKKLYKEKYGKYKKNAKKRKAEEEDGVAPSGGRRLKLNQ